MLPILFRSCAEAKDSLTRVWIEVKFFEDDASSWVELTKLREANEKKKRAFDVVMIKFLARQQVCNKKEFGQILSQTSKWYNAATAKSPTTKHQNKTSVNYTALRHTLPKMLPVQTLVCENKALH